MRTTIIGIGALAVILLLALLLSRSSADTIPYAVTGKSGEIEFRHYPELVLATVDTAGDDAGFNLLFAYISGSNKPREKIPMTAPVINLAENSHDRPGGFGCGIDVVCDARRNHAGGDSRPAGQPGTDRDHAGTGHCRYPVFGICTTGRRGCGSVTVAGRAEKRGDCDGRPAVPDAV